MAADLNSVYVLLRSQAARRAEFSAIEFQGGTLSYQELLCEVDRHASLLRNLGVGRGDRVGIHLQKSPEEVVATLAIAALGAVFVNINYQWSASQVRHVLNDCDICVLITDTRKTDALAELLNLSTLRSVVITDLIGPHDRFVSWDHVAGPFDWDRGYQPLSTDLAALLYTSGSTGTPKGVMVTQRNLLDGARVVCQYLELEESDRILSVPPFNFDYGLNQLIDVLWLGATLVLQATPLPVEIVRAVDRHRITVLPLVAPSWIQVLRVLDDEPMTIRPLRIATNTGGKIPTGLLNEVPRLLPKVSFFLMYGLTEAFRSTYLPPVWFQQKAGAIGIAVPDNEIFVVDPERGICGPNETGELLHRGCLVTRGYWGRPDLSAQKIRPNPHLRELIGDEPVVHSGDLVRLDDDGVCWFVGRLDNMIKCSGFRISPTEVEDLLSAIDGVIEVIAFGVEDDELGQVVHVAAYVEAQITEEKLLVQQCRKTMPNYMQPRRIYLQRAPFPRTSTGKLDRQAIIEECRALLLL